MLDELRRANPVDRDEVVVPDELAARVLAAARPPRRRRLMPALAAAAVAVTILAAMLVADDGAGPTLAERAYAASTGPGITHWRTDMTGYANGRVGSRQRVEGWRLGEVTHVLRSDVVHGKAHVTVDERSVGRRTRTWMSGSDDWVTTTRARAPAVEMIPSGDPMAAFRRAYRAGRLRDLGGGRFEVRFKHLPAGTVVYEVDERSGRPRRLVVRSAGSRMVITFPVYERLRATSANRARLALLPHPGAGPSTEPAARSFAALRTGARPAEADVDDLRRLTRFMGRFRIDPDGIRVLTEDRWLLPGRGYLCLASRTPRGDLGTACQTVRKAVANGVSSGTPEGGLTVAVPDGVRAVEGRYRWHGRWRRFPVRDGVAHLPRLGYQTRLVR